MNVKTDCCSTPKNSPTDAKKRKEIQSIEKQNPPPMLRIKVTLDHAPTVESIPIQNQSVFAPMNTKNSSS